MKSRKEFRNLLKYKMSIFYTQDFADEIYDYFNPSSDDMLEKVQEALEFIVEDLRGRKRGHSYQRAREALVLLQAAKEKK